MKWLIPYALTMLVAHAAQLGQGVIRNGALGIVPTPSFSPTNITGLAYWWHFEDTPMFDYQGRAGQGQTTNWTDRISSIPLIPKAGSGVNGPTNSPTGLRYLNSSGKMLVTNAVDGVSFGTNFSTWMAFEKYVTNNNPAYMYGSANAQNAFAFSSNNIAAIWANTWHVSAAPHPDSFDNELVNAQGEIILNSVDSGTTVDMPTSSFALASVGGAYTFTAYCALDLQHFLVWTNYALTVTDCANLHNWRMTNAITNVTANLLAHYKFSEGSGTNVADSSGNNRTGSIYNSTGSSGWVTGAPTGYALGLTNGAYVDLTNFCDNLPEFTLSLWVRSTNTSGGQTMLISKIQDNINLGVHAGGWYVLWENAQPRFLIWDGDTSTSFRETSPAAFGNGSWHHVVQIATEGTNLWTYVDGVSNTGSLTGSGLPPPANLSNTNHVRIGNDYVSSLGYNGEVSEVRLYDRALSLLEISYLYRAARFYSNFVTKPW